MNDSVSVRDLLSKTWMSFINNKAVIFSGMLFLGGLNLVLVQLFQLVGLPVVSSMKPVSIQLSSFSISSMQAIIEKAHTYFVTSFEWKLFFIKICYCLLVGVIILHYIRIMLSIAKNKITYMSFIDSFLYVINSFRATALDTLYASASACVVGIAVFLGMIIASFPYFMLIEYIEKLMGAQGKAIVVLLLFAYIGVLFFFLIRFSFFIFCMLDNNGRGPWESLRCSWLITQNKVLTLVRIVFTLFMFMLIFVFLSTIIGLFSFFFLPGFVSLFMGSVFVIALILMYMMNGLFMTHVYLAMSNAK